MFVVPRETKKGRSFLFQLMDFFRNLSFLMPSLTIKIITVEVFSKLDFECLHQISSKNLNLDVEFILHPYLLEEHTKLK